MNEVYNFSNAVIENREKSNGRLGLTKNRLPKTTIPDVPFPTQLKIPQASIVSLSAAGMYVSPTQSGGSDDLMP